MVALGQIKVSGKVVNSTGYPMSYAVVELCKDTTVVQAVLTDSAGVYQMQVKQGKYYQNCRYAGSLQKGQAVTIVRDTIINIEFVKQIALEEVVVSSKKPLIERKIDRYIFNVENSIVSTGSDAWEALSKTPGVRANNQLSLVGKGSVSVMIDDRLLRLNNEALTNFLRSIPSDNIQKIEVITNPPSKYDAQGNSGLINIVLKKNKRQGYYGSVRLGQTQTTYYPLSFGGGSLNYRAKKISLYANTSFMYGYIGPIDRTVIYYPQQTWMTENKRKDNSKAFNGKAGIDYEMNKNIKMGLSYTSGGHNIGTFDNATTTIYNNQSQIDSLLTTHSFPDNTTKLGDLNLYAEFLLDTLLKKITLDGSRFNFNYHNQRDFFNKRFYRDGVFIPNSYTYNVSTSDQNLSLYTLKADVELPFKKFTFSTGGKIYFLYNHSDVALYKIQNEERKLEQDNANQFIYRENVQALYMDVEKKWKAWEFKIGIRGEKTQASGQSSSIHQTNKYNYSRFFPTAFISYKANKKNDFSLSYGRRINRPDYWLLNPFRWYHTPYSYSEGYPFLQPSYSSVVEISHIYKGLFITAFSFSHKNDGFSQVVFVEKERNKQIIRPLNFLTEYSYQLTNTLTYSPMKWMESTLQAKTYYRLSNSAVPQTRQALKGWTGYISLDNQMTFNQAKTLMGSLSFWYESPAVSENDNMLSQYNVDMGVKSLLFKKNLQLSLIWADVFRSSIHRFYNYFNDIRQEWYSYYDNRRVRLVIVYNFGKNQFSRQERRAGNEEEKRRAR